MASIKENRGFRNLRLSRWAKMQAVALLILAPVASQAGSCLAPVRPFVPSDSQAARDYADIIRRDFEGLHHGHPGLLPLPRAGACACLRRSPRSQSGLWPISTIGRGLMGNLRSIRLAAHGNQTPITPSYIYFLDNRFHPLATSQKVCDAWQRQSEAMARWRSSERWLKHVSKRVLVSRSWRRGSDATSHLSPVLKAAERRVDVVELVVLARVIGFDKIEVLSIVEAATEPDHRI